jgi:uncharacterized iron-regulated membrane protein
MSILLHGSAPAYGARAALRLSRDAVYRAVWRWHFYAGLLCLPFLISLSATGALYLFKDEINGSLFAYRTQVAPQASSALGPDRLIFNALQAVPDASPVSYTDPAMPDRSAVVTLASGAHRILVYLDPYTGDVLDRVARDAEFMTVVRGLHSLAYLGASANAAIEVVAGFALILVVTGAYLWWPRHQKGSALGVRGTPRYRVWWRDLHAVTGLVAGAGILFLALTGLPWSIWWGQQLRTWSNAAGRYGRLGRSRRCRCAIACRSPAGRCRTRRCRARKPDPQQPQPSGSMKPPRSSSGSACPAATNWRCRSERRGSTRRRSTRTTSPASG